MIATLLIGFLGGALGALALNVVRYSILSWATKRRRSLDAVQRRDAMAVHDSEPINHAALQSESNRVRAAQALQRRGA